jgi:hypothetical protein
VHVVTVWCMTKVALDALFSLQQAHSLSQRESLDFPIRAFLLWALIGPGTILGSIASSLP